MNAGNREFEAKFYLHHLADMRASLIKQGAALIQERTLERNWRFDDEHERLQANDVVLRVRQDTRARMTYKQGLASMEERLEIEVEISDADQAQRLLKALGYHIVASYEKYRETFEWQDALIMLDELPFGCFVEVEGQDLEHVRVTSAALNLAWEHRVSRNYLALFELLKEHMQWHFNDLSFARFNQLPPIQPQDLDVTPAR